MRLKCLIVSILLITVAVKAQERKDFTDLYLKAITSLADGDTVSAEEYFTKSYEQYDDAPSYFQLAVMYNLENTVTKLGIARENIKKAIELEPSNILYRLTFANILEKLYHMSLAEFDARSRAFLEYEKIVEIDSTVAFAWYKMGQFKRDDYNEFSESYIRTSSIRKNNYNYFETESFGEINRTISGTNEGFTANDNYQLTETQSRDLNALQAFIDEQEPMISYEEESEEDFLDAEYFYQRAIEVDPTNYKARLELGFLYEDATRPENAVPFFEELVEENPINKDAHLFLGLLYYEVGELDKSYESFQNALSLMSKREFQDYTFYSVLKLLEPILGDRIGTFNMTEMKIFMDTFWKVREPFNLTEYNERQLEHYARITYANFRFSLPNRNIDGWKTDMGEMMIRYGKPPARKRFRQGFSSSDIGMYDASGVNYEYLENSNIKTEIWYYNNVAIAFTDEYASGEYRYHDPYAHSRRSFAQTGNDKLIAKNNLIKNNPEEYYPKFSGDIISVPYNAVQFKGEGKTDVYINYAVEYSDSIQNNEINGFDHNIGLFFFDKSFAPLVERRKRFTVPDSSTFISLTDTSGYFVNSLKMELTPQYGNCAFEYRRNCDKGVASYHGRYNVIDYTKDELNMSDVLVASEIEYDSNFGSKNFIQRGEYSILPNPGHIFRKGNNLFIYFEIYNLSKAEDDLTNFVQSIEVEEFKDDDLVTIDGLIGSFLETIGIIGEDKIELTSSYQTQENDPKVYLQLDLTDYDPGKYLIKVNIKDNITQKETKRESLIIWQ